MSRRLSNEQHARMAFASSVSSPATASAVECTSTHHVQLARADRQQRLKPGLVFTIEPMLAAGIPQIFLDRDGWTVRTAHHCRSAHEEHAIMVAENGRLFSQLAHN